ncbi:MAG: hypothetical protein JWM52_728 [Candidatus Saccharibacteria bacterium]|nr:hypothetical protein [Candidatus Saccharibacteria bacterium]
MAERRNFVSWNRQWVVIQRHFPIIFKPFAIALICAVIWKFVIFDNHISFSKQAENPLLFIILPLVSFVYVIFASIGIRSVFDEYKIVSKAVVKRDIETFLLHRDEQLPILLHILVGIPSIILIGLTAFFHYEDWLIGLFAVFSVIFVVVTAWIVSTELDDFEKSIWFKEKIPQDWHGIDVQLYFEKKEKK